MPISRMQMPRQLSRGGGIMEVAPRQGALLGGLKTGEEYKDDNEWKSKGIAEEDIRRDIKLIMPSLDIFGKTK